MRRRKEKRKEKENKRTGKRKGGTNHTYLHIQVNQSGCITGRGYMYATRPQVDLCQLRLITLDTPKDSPKNYLK